MLPLCEGSLKSTFTISDRAIELDKNDLRKSYFKMQVLPLILQIRFFKDRLSWLFWHLYLYFQFFEALLWKPAMSMPPWWKVGLSLPQVTPTSNLSQAPLVAVTVEKNSVKEIWIERKRCTVWWTNVHFGCKYVNFDRKICISGEEFFFRTLSV